MAGGVRGRGMYGREACMVWGGGMHGRGCAWQGACMAEGGCMGGKMAIAADGTHPTGMHSCVI